MGKKTESTIDKFIKSLSLEEKKEYDQEREFFIIQEMVYAAMEKDYDSVKKLAKMIKVSPDIVNDIIDPDSFRRVLGIIGYNIIIEKKDSRISLVDEKSS